MAPRSCHTPETRTAGHALRQPAEGTAEDWRAQAARGEGDDRGDLLDVGHLSGELAGEPREELRRGLLLLARIDRAGAMLGDDGGVERHELLDDDIVIGHGA